MGPLGIATAALTLAASKRYLPSVSQGRPAIGFQETSTKHPGTYIRVINGPFSPGWIAVPANGGPYRYFEPERNEHTPALSGPDLVAVK